MTKEEAIEIFQKQKALCVRENDWYNALSMAIEALEQINKIKQIIAIDNSVIQEDVMKYKMICEVVEE